MFFFFDTSSASELLRKCFKCYFRKSFEKKCYCDVSELFSDQYTKKYFTENTTFSYDSTRIKKLYARKYPCDIRDLDYLAKVYGSSCLNEYTEDDEVFAILYWSCKIFKSKMPFEKHKTSITKKFLEFIKNEYHLGEYKNYGSIIYNPEDVTIHTVASVSSYLHTLDKYDHESTLYYRGHSKTSYLLRPSIMRTEHLFENEKHIYQELLINCPDEFRGFTRHIDYLVKMQHYGLPTRLLDITRNPLVALYFACCNNKDDIGEIILFNPESDKIKYSNSDTVSMLASLPIFSYDEQFDLIDKLYAGQRESPSIKRFVHEVQNEKPAFSDDIKVDDLVSPFVVLPEKNNARIIKQDGCFIICGQDKHPEEHLNSKMRLRVDGKHVLIFIKDKNKILDELDLLAINKSSLFPEIDMVAEYIKKKYTT